MDLKNFQTGAFRESPEHWLTDYLDRRARLGAAESEFHCDPACTRPGCKISTLPVPVSLIDLLGVARHLKAPLAAVYQNYYTLGLLANERQDWLRRLSLRLNKPCPFLRHDLCGIYPVRPLACMLFPEYLAFDNPFGINAGQAQFGDFLCLRQTLRLSRPRAEIIRQLQKMWDREELVSNYFLFKARRCSVDFGKMTRELQDAAQIDPESSDSDTDLPGAIANRVMEEFLARHLADSTILGQVPEKIARLAHKDEQLQLLRLFQDEEAIRDIRRKTADVELSFRFKKGRLIRTRQPPLPREYTFF